MAVTVGPQGRLVIPAALRRQLGIAVGDRLVAHVEGKGRLVLQSREAAVARLHELFAGIPRTVSLADELIKERRLEARRERDR